MDNGEEEQLLIHIIFLGMYLITGGVWLAFYNVQGQDSLFNSSYDYWVLLLFQIISGFMLVGYVRLTQVMWAMYFLCVCGIITLPMLIEGYSDAMQFIMPIQALTKTRAIVLGVHVTTYAVIAVELICTYREKQKRGFI